MTKSHMKEPERWRIRTDSLTGATQGLRYYEEEVMEARVAADSLTTTIILHCCHPTADVSVKYNVTAHPSKTSGQRIF